MLFCSFCSKLPLYQTHSSVHCWRKSCSFRICTCPCRAMKPVHPSWGPIKEIHHFPHRRRTGLSFESQKCSQEMLMTRISLAAGGCPARQPGLSGLRYSVQTCGTLPAGGHVASADSLIPVQSFQLDWQTVFFHLWGKCCTGVPGSRAVRAWHRRPRDCDVSPPYLLMTQSQVRACENSQDEISGVLESLSTGESAQLQAMGRDFPRTLAGLGCSHRVGRRIANPLTCRNPAGSFSLITSRQYSISPVDWRSFSVQ